MICNISPCAELKLFPIDIQIENTTFYTTDGVLARNMKTFE